MKIFDKLNPKLKFIITKKLKKLVIKKNLRSFDENNSTSLERFVNYSKEDSSLTKISNDLKKNIYSHKNNNDSNNFNNEQFTEYRKVIETIHLLTTEFEIGKFRNVVSYMREYSIDDGMIIKKLENILFENLKIIDCNTKSDIVLIIGKNLQKKKIKFNEDLWHRIYFDFLNLSEMNILTFKDYYNFTLTFDKIKNVLIAFSPKYVNDFERFINHDNLLLFNSGKIKFSTLDDLILLSSLVHTKIFRIGSLSDTVWLAINQLISKNSVKLNINNLLVLTSFFINFSEISTKAPVLLNDAICEINKFINSLFTNYEFFDSQEKMNLINFSDNLFNYYLIFIHQFTNSFNLKNESKNDFTNLLNFDSFIVRNLIKIYTEKIKLSNNFNFFQELRILIFLSKEIKYHDKEFWEHCAKNLKNFLKFDFLTKISQILPKRLKNSNMEDNIRALEIEEMSKLFYYGVIIEVFSTVKYYEEDFWNVVFDKFDQIIPTSKKDPLILLQFICLHCKNLYKNKNHAKNYNNLIKKFSPEFKRIFLNREILDFLIGINFYNEEFNREKNNKLILDLVNPSRPYDSIDEVDGKTNPSEEFKNVPNPTTTENMTDNLIKLEIEDLMLDNSFENEDLIIDNSENETLEEFEKIKYNMEIETNINNSENDKEPSNIIIFITYINLLSNKYIFDEEVNYIFLFKLEYINIC